MLPRFCRVCYQICDESILNLRRYSIKYSRIRVDQEVNYESDYEEENFNPENEEPDEEIEKPKKFCIIKCKRSQYDFYKGQVFPKFQPMPLASRSWHHRKSVGDYFTIYPMDDMVTNNEAIDTSSTFEEFDLNINLLKNLKDNQFFHPTEIQKRGIPKILNGHHVALTAEAGSGKTNAFLIPLLHRILQWKTITTRSVNQPLAIILTPSKELTLQITRVAKFLAKDLNIDIIKLLGGHSKQRINNPPVGEVDLIVATAGIFSTFLTAGIYQMEFTKYVVFDEADTLFDDSFISTVHKILNFIPISSDVCDSIYPKMAQLVLNSATIPQNLSDLVGNYMNPESILTVTTGNEHRITVPQKFWRVGKSEKPMILLKYVKPKAKNKIPVIIFSNSSATCDFTSIFLEQFGIKCINIHKNLPMDIRKRRMMEFQNGRYPVLTATDAGARGLDTTIAKDVINFDFPLISAEYIHRCGRIGRIGSPKDCRVINLISKPLEIVMTCKIEYAIRKLKTIPLIDLVHDKYDEDGQFLHSKNVKDGVHELDWNKYSSDVEDDDQNETTVKKQN